MARRGGMWGELQRELARRQRLEQQRLRVTEQAAKRAAREHDQAMRAAAREAVTDQRERKRIYIEDRKAETACPSRHPNGASCSMRAVRMINRLCRADHAQRDACGEVKPGSLCPNVLVNLTGSDEPGRGGGHR